MVVFIESKVLEEAALRDDEIFSSLCNKLRTFNEGESMVRWGGGGQDLVCNKLRTFNEDESMIRRGVRISSVTSYGPLMKVSPWLGGGGSRSLCNKLWTFNEGESMGRLGGRGSVSSL